MKRPVLISVSAIRSGLVATRCDSSASERRTASSALWRSVSSLKIDRLAGPPSASTRTPVARTTMRRPWSVRIRNSCIGSAAPTARFSRSVMRCSARLRSDARS